MYVVGDSGTLYDSFENSATGIWEGITPERGSAINAVDCDDARKGHAVDGTQTVFVTGDGTSWGRARHR